MESAAYMCVREYLLRLCERSRAAAGKNYLNFIGDINFAYVCSARARVHEFSSKREERKSVCVCVCACICISGARSSIKDSQRSSCVRVIYIYTFRAYICALCCVVYDTVLCTRVHQRFIGE